MLVLRIGTVLKVDHVCFAPDGRALVGCTESGAYFWRAISADQPAEHISGTSWARFAKFTPDGGQLFVAGYDLVRVAVATRKEAVVPLWGQHHIQFDLSPDGKRFIAMQLVNNSGLYDTRMACRVIGPKGGRTLWDLQCPGVQNQRPQFLPGGKRFVRVDETPTFESGTSEYNVVTYDAANCEPRHETAAFAEPMHHSVVAPDGRCVAGINDARISLRPIKAGASQPAIITNGTKKPFSAIAFHPSGKFLAATSNGKTGNVVQFYSVETRELLRTFEWDIGKMRSVYFSPDGTLAATGSDSGRVVVWDVDL